MVGDVTTHKKPSEHESTRALAINTEPGIAMTRSVTRRPESAAATLSSHRGSSESIVRPAARSVQQSPNKSQKKPGYSHISYIILIMIHMSCNMSPNKPGCSHISDNKYICCDISPNKPGCSHIVIMYMSYNMSPNKSGC